MKHIFFCLFLVGLTQPIQAQLSTPAPASKRIEVTVHPGIELFTVVQLLAGQYKMPTPSAYAKAVETYFKPYANHPAVEQVKKMGRVYADLAELGYCFDAFPAIRIYYPDSLHWYKKYGKDTVQTYMRLCKQFAQETKFWDFYQQHQPDYKAWATPVQQELTQKGWVAKLDSFYRFDGHTNWTICLDPLNSWGAHAIMTKTINPRYADHVVYNVGFFDQNAKDTDAPTFIIGSEPVSMVWHEGSHSYTNELQKRYAADIAKLTYLLNKGDEGMKRNNINTWAHCFDENLVRGIVIALFRQYRSPKEARKQAAREIVGDFLYAEDIADVLTSNYIGNPAYVNFPQFFPQILTYLAQKYPNRQLTDR
ncbi:DUF4932 domain-containing protein [Spirosoma sp.]|uniref:DUF4932 domain-containing protein n=1 Tax=Spirosoma sp. TaxID=1899569 RepID=UPI002622C516|nr:DUF4932 domain-containing protein [Spirosoma sp.]MCX6218522.1 DUF4932 domain-containing protein [Spirosoma sp.]